MGYYRPLATTLVACYPGAERSEVSTFAYINEEEIAVAGMGELILGFVSTPIGAAVALALLVGAGLYIRWVFK